MGSRKGSPGYNFGWFDQTREIRVWLISNIVSPGGCWVRKTLEARVAVDSNATAIVGVGITGLVGRPAGSFMYANIDELEEYLMASLSSLLRGRPGKTDFLFPVCFPTRPCFLWREERGGNKSTGASGGASGVGTGEAPPSVAGAKDAMICVAAWKGVAARRGKGG